MGWMTNPTSVRRGAIYLVNLNPQRGAEPGKTRPCLVIQEDLLNEAGHASTVILPLTTRLVSNTSPLRFDVSARENLREDSQVLIDQPRTIDNRRFASGILAELTRVEIATVEIQLKIVLGIDN